MFLLFFNYFIDPREEIVVGQTLRLTKHTLSCFNYHPHPSEVQILSHSLICLGYAAAANPTSLGGSFI